MDVTIQIREDILENLKPLLANLHEEKSRGARKYKEYASKVENGTIRTGIEAETYRQWAEEADRDEKTILAAMWALYGQAE